VARPAPGADRSVAVLELLAGHPSERFTLSEVARRCNLNKATAHALLSALSERGVLLRHPDEKRYSLGPRLVAIGDAARHGYTAVDFVPPVLAALAAETGLWARAWRLTGDHLISVAQAGAPAHLAGSGPARVPVVPPVGALFMAWSDPPTVEAWLARAGAVDAVRPALESLPAIRQQGFAVTMASPEWRALSGSGRSTGSDDVAVDDPAVRRTLLLAVAHQRLLVPVIADVGRYRPADVGAPVFGATGAIELSVSVTRLTDDEMSGSELWDLGRRVVAAADGLTAAVCGQQRT
jgi:DNA-binding IclR family transcriptional regulator